MNPLFDRERASLFPNYDRLPIGEVEHAAGVYIYTKDGKRYLDCVAGLGVNALGHSHPGIVEAIKMQAEKYLHLSNLYYQSPQLDLAEALAGTSGFERVFFSNSGTEAVEGALKLARKYHFDSGAKDKTEIIGFSNGFHGRTYGALSVMDKVKYRTGYGPFIEDARTLPFNDANALCAITGRTAAVILEPIQGEGGIVEATSDFVAALQEFRDEHKFLIIADEIQSGVGRTGDFFAFEAIGLRPDIVVCAKAIGGGLPLGAILTSHDIAKVMGGGVHGTTFGGNALACVAGSAVLSELQNGLLKQVAENGAILRQQLINIRQKYPERIVNIRGRGYMLGVEFDGPAKDIQQSLLDQQIITNVTNVNVLRLLPPLVFAQEHVQILIHALDNALQ